MDGRKKLRRQALRQILIGGLLVLILFFFLDWRDPRENIRPLDILEGPIKFVVGLPISDGPRLLYGAIFLFLISVFLGTGFFVQFALPVQTLRQRLLAWLYLFYDVSAMGGPSYTIDNGVAPTLGGTSEGRLQRGRAVLVLDTASGAVLRTRTAFTRSIGPGLHFTCRGEYLEDAVDLHRQIWPDPPLGPRGDEDPFAPWDEKKLPRVEYDESQRRRLETSGMTRDGIEVVSNIFAVSRLDPDLKERPWLEPPASVQTRLGRLAMSASKPIHSEFEYNAEAVRLAVTGETVNPRPGVLNQERRYDWYQLPALLAVDLWREYLRRFTFSQLFEDQEEHGEKTALQVIREMILARLTMRQVSEIDAVGKPTGHLTDSYEYHVLQNRGIRVLFVPVRNLHFPNKVDRDLENKWFSTWRMRAERERDVIERRRSYRVHAGSQEALRAFALHATRRFDEQFLSSVAARERDEQRRQLQETLERLVRGTLAQCVNDTQLHQRLSGEEEQLLEIINWLRRLRRQ